MAFTNSWRNVFLRDFRLNPKNVLLKSDWVKENAKTCSGCSVRVWPLHSSLNTHGHSRIVSFLQLIGFFIVFFIFVNFVFNFNPYTNIKAGFFFSMKTKSCFENTIYMYLHTR